MTLYLQMDGVDDYIKLPSLTFNRMVLDFKVRIPAATSKSYFDFRSGFSFGYIQRTTSNVDTIGNAGQMSVYINGSGSPSSNNVVMTAYDTRTIWDVRWASVGTDDGNIFSNSGGSVNTGPAGEIYNIKIYNGATLVAHYDMTTGTVQDQSGNGNHATLTGGTFVDDGVGGGSVVDAGTITLSGDTTLNAIGSSIASGDSTLSAISSLSIDGSIICNGTSTFFGESSFNPLPNLISNGESGLSASTSLTAEGISYDPSKQIIGKITLTGKRDLLTNLVATRDLNIKVTVKRELITRLVGDIK